MEMQMQMETLEQVAPLAVTLRMDDETHAALRRNEGAVALAESFIVDCPEMADEAAQQLRRWATGMTRVDKMYKSFIEPAKQIIDHAKNLFNPATRALLEADAILRGKLMAYTTEQQRIVEEQRRVAMEAERIARQKAEAAAERARAAARAAELQRQAAEAEAARAKAAAEGNARAAAEAAASAAKLTEKANAALANGEAKANSAQLEAAASVMIVAAPAKIDGFGTRDNWKAEFVTNELVALPKIVAAIAAGRTDLLALLCVDMKAADRLAKALKSAFSVPGMTAVNRPSSVVRKAA